MIALAVKLSIGQGTTDRGHLARLLKEGPQRRAVIGRTRLGDLGEDDPPRQINDHDPLAPVPPGEPLAMIPHTVDEESANCAWG